jgi:peptidoglycan hydrolase CwlO-like protein
VGNKNPITLDIKMKTKSKQTLALAFCLLLINGLTAQDYDYSNKTKAEIGIMIPQLEDDLYWASSVASMYSYQKDCFVQDNHFLQNTIYGIDGSVSYLEQDRAILNQSIEEKQASINACAAQIAEKQSVLSSLRQEENQYSYLQWEAYSALSSGSLIWERDYAQAQANSCLEMIATLEWYMMYDHVNNLPYLDAAWNDYYYWLSAWGAAEAAIAFYASQVPLIEGELAYLSNEICSLEGEISALEGQQTWLQSEYDSLVAERDSVNSNIESLNFWKPIHAAQILENQMEINRLTQELYYLNASIAIKKDLLKSLREYYNLLEE